MSATHRRIHGRQLAMFGPGVRRALARGTVSVVGDDWEALARRMRLLGVSVLSLPNGIQITLGEAPAAQAESPTQQRLSPEQEEAARREEIRRVSSLASGGPRLPVGHQP